MSAQAQMSPEFTPADERDLAEDIARAMHQRPLMSRLARVGTTHTQASPHSAPSQPEVESEAASAPLSGLSVPVDNPRPSIEEQFDDLGHVATLPPRAQWLDNARIARRRAQVRRAIAWTTTLAIAVAIIGAALLLLRA